MAAIGDDDVDMDTPLERLKQRMDVGRQVKSTAMQTGGVNYGGRVFRLGGPRQSKPLAPPTIEKIVQRIAFSVPIVRASLADVFLRNFIIATLVGQNIKESRATVLPNSLMVHQVSDETYTKFRE